MPSVCPQCGAAFASPGTCRDHFNASQATEMEQPAYGAVHHLSVPCYMLQHNAYSREGWLEVRKLLAKFVYEGWTPAMARRDGRLNADSRRRAWSITRGAKLPGVEQIAWSCTLADVHLDTAEAYCAGVRRWAESILADSEQLIGELDRAASQ